MGNLLCKITLTSGANQYVYGVDTTNRLKRVFHPEQSYSQIAQVLIDNSNGALTSLSFEGYQGVLSYGYVTGAGDEYSATAPLKVKAMELFSAQGILVCQLVLYGIPNQLNEDEASQNYTPDSEDINTIKSLINFIAGATLAPYLHCTAFTVTYDSEDSVIDSYIPKDYFTVYKGETRLAKLKELLGLTKCVMVVKADGAIHIFNPTISGNTWVATTAYVLGDYAQPTTPNNNWTYRCTTAGTSGGTEPTWPTTLGGTVTDGTAVWTAVGFDYEYNDTILATNHTFFSKVYRNRLVLPNKVVVASSVDNTPPQYTGSATSAASYALLPKTHFETRRLASNAEATAIAKAIIQRAELDHERGNGFAPMNVGQEAYDYVKITDSREGDNRIGNVGWLTRNYEPGKFDFRFGFGNSLLEAQIGEGGREQLYVTYAELTDAMKTLIEEFSEIIRKRERVPKWHVTQQLIIPVV